MSNNTENLVPETNIEPAAAEVCGTPLDETTEWSGVINRKREAERQQAEAERQRAAEERESARRMKAVQAEEEFRRQAEQLAAAAQKKYRNKIAGCLVGIVLMVLLIGVSFVLQHEGYIKFPWPIVITGVFGAVAAFFSGRLWEVGR